MAVLDKILGFVFSGSSFQRLMTDKRELPENRALLIGTYGNSILYALELLAVIRYFSASSCTRDSHLVKAMISFVFLSDTVCTISNYACVYLVRNKNVASF